MTLDGSVRDPADEAALQRLVHLYARGMDGADEAVLRAIFTPQAVIEGAWRTLAGIDAILGSAREMKSKYLNTMHLVHNPTFEIEGDAATGIVWCVAHNLQRTAGRTHELVDMAFRYSDAFARTGHRWQFTRRKLELLWKASRPASATAG